MRVLLTWSDDDGVSRAAIIKGPEDEESEPSEVAEVAWQRVAKPHGDGIYTVVTLPDDDFRPDVYDEYGAEVPMQFIDL